MLINVSYVYANSKFALMHSFSMSRQDECKGERNRAKRFDFIRLLEQVSPIQFSKRKNLLEINLSKFFE